MRKIIARKTANGDYISVMPGIISHEAQLNAVMPSEKRQSHEPDAAGSLRESDEKQIMAVIDSLDDMLSMKTAHDCKDSNKEIINALNAVIRLFGSRSKSVS